MEQQEPFGYQFEQMFHAPTDFQDTGLPLLNEHENQELTEFFSQTNPFYTDAPPPSTPAGHRDGLEEQQQNWNYVPPPTLHGISTISDQAQLHHGFHNEQAFPPHAFSANHLANTPDDLAAASTLYNNAQAGTLSHQHAGPNGRSYSFHSQPPSTPTAFPSTPPSHTFHGMPMVPTQHGLMNEQLAALLPHHSENGTVDAAMAAQFGSIQPAPQPDYERMRQLNRPPIKRSYTYGTDNAFNSTGYVGPTVTHTVGDEIIQLLREDVRHNPPPHARRSVASVGSASPGLPIGLTQLPSDYERQSEDTSSPGDAGREQPVKRRRKGANSISIKTEQTPARKSISETQVQKNRKPSSAESPSKAKRKNSAAAAAVAKMNRENLTEAQKRNNHILSEQKRRNLIKRGFDDLHDLVPEVRNGGLSKSSVLMEAASFLEKILRDNDVFETMLSPENGE